MTIATEMITTVWHF